MSYVHSYSSFLLKSQYYPSLDIFIWKNNSSKLCFKTLCRQNFYFVPVQVLFNPKLFNVWTFITFKIKFVFQWILLCHFITHRHVLNFRWICNVTHYRCYPKIIMWGLHWSLSLLTTKSEAALNSLFWSRKKNSKNWHRAFIDKVLNGRLWCSFLVLRIFKTLFRHVSSCNA